jgi:S1-C subfamily serine protease
MGVPADTTGVAVDNVTPGSPAEIAATDAQLDLTRSIIQKINHTSVKSRSEFDAAMSTVTGPTVTLIVLYVDSDQQAHQQAVMLRF